MMRNARYGSRGVRIREAQNPGAPRLSPTSSRDHQPTEVDSTLVADALEVDLTRAAMMRLRKQPGSMSAKRVPPSRWCRDHDVVCIWFGLEIKTRLRGTRTSAEGVVRNL